LLCNGIVTPLRFLSKAKCRFISIVQR